MDTKKRDSIGPVEYDGVVVETIVRDTVSEDILANSKTG